SGSGITRAQQTAKRGIEFDKNQPRGVNAMTNKRLGDRTRAWTEFNDRAVRLRIDATRHRARQYPARRHDRNGRQRLLNPRANEPNLVVKTQALLFGAGE